MAAKSKPLLMLCLIAGLQSACSRPDPASPAPPAAQSLVPSTAPLATEASVTTAAPPVPDRPGARAVPMATPPDDRMEPDSLENARLPGGGKLDVDPVPGKRKN